MNRNGVNLKLKMILDKEYVKKIEELLSSKISWEGFTYLYFPKENVNFSNGKRCSIVKVGEDFGFNTFKKQLLEKRCQFITVEELNKIKTNII